MRTLQGVVVLIFGIILIRLAYIQLVDPQYEKLARGNALRHVIQYPPRGEVFDRNGEYLAQNRACYDLMVIYRELPRTGFDTLRMLDLLGISRAKLDRALRNARMSPRIPYMVTNFIPSEVKLRFDENNFPGFFTVYRTIRRYPREIGGNLLGDVGEINAAQLKRNPEYRAGDYIGQSGVEKAYEEVLRGKNGVKINEIDTHGVVKGSYMNGLFDSLPEPGDYIVVARKAKGTGEWFVGGVTDENRRTVTLPFDYLAPGKEYVATLYADAPDADYQTNPQAYVIRTGKVGQRTELDVEMARGGGFAISIREATDADRKLRRLK